MGPAVLAQQHAVGSRSQRLDIGYALLRRDLEFPDLETQDGRRRRYLFVVITAVREEIIKGEPFLGCRTPDEAQAEKKAEMKNNLKKSCTYKNYLYFCSPENEATSCESDQKKSSNVALKSFR